MTRVKRFRYVAAGVIVASAVTGAAVGSIPVGEHPRVQTVAVATDPATLYNDAQQKFGTGDVTGGLDALRQAVTLSPADGQSLALQAIWSDQVDDASTASAALRRLAVVNPLLAGTARTVTEAVTAAAAIVPATQPQQVAGNPAIVILGFGLSPKGEMAPELVKRLEAGLAQAQVLPSAPIVVTGGKPQNGVTEAGAMRAWLIRKGVDATRIVTEEQSVSTVSNAQNTAPILRPRGITDIVLVTSPNHIRRAAADFGSTGLKVVSTVTTPTDLAKYTTPLAKDKQTGIRVEATRTAGLPASRKPLLSTDELPDVGPGLLGEIGGKVLEQLRSGGSSGG
ncbi:YdcF family protein [Gordonia desulfuricans]|uniref:YdcF family protein n=1 Tax=Gordonia desulfuricans TaxID=89051 RepID=A0A7K3LK19_9ACTN|nr:MULTISPECIES: YdcF family protein [Gordonia]EMP12434.2 hypothetical protein ISGA_2306 [Gordonia sp. NB41Y]NDK88586.1 YdcF family protein [Gordonia desulfuricans]WLP88856.1 YdcF family protein [Gordonia sp. NB41Y]